MLRARRFSTAEPKLPIGGHADAQVGGEAQGVAICGRSGRDLQLCRPGAIDREARVEGCHGHAGCGDEEVGRQWYRRRDMARVAGIELCQGALGPSFAPAFPGL